MKTKTDIDHNTRDALLRVLRCAFNILIARIPSEYCDFERIDLLFDDKYHVRSSNPLIDELIYVFSRASLTRYTIPILITMSQIPFNLRRTEPTLLFGSIGSYSVVN